ncbi:MAG: NACHT domain-containing protein, partial [Cyanobacteriota bacterium]
EFDLADEEQTKQILKQGKVLILLDGLDEVPSLSRREVQEHIYKFSQSTQYYKNRFILTCRTQTTEYISDKFDCVEVAEFKPEQVESFARNWFVALAETPEQAAEIQAKFIAKLTENKPTAELAVTPILLSLTCWVFNDLKDLPAKRSNLYERGVNLLLQEWDEKRGIRRTAGSERYRNLSLAGKKKLLSYLAAHKFEQEQFILFEQDEIQEYLAEYLDISNEESQEVLKAIEAQHGLLIERAQRIWSFSHRTFQEYLTAQHIYHHRQIEQLVANHLTNQHIYHYSQIEQLVTANLTNERWEEVFLLVAGLMGGGADELLLLMEKETQQYINTPKLQTLLTWADWVTARSEGDCKPAVKRATVIFIARRFNYYLDCDIALAIARALDSTLDHSFERDINHDFALLNNPKRDPNLDFELVKALDSDYALTRVFNLALGGVCCKPEIDSQDRSGYILISAFNSAIQSEFALIHELEDIKIFQYVNFKALITRLKELQTKFTKPNKILEVEGYQIVEMEVYQEFVKRIYHTWIEALNLSLETVNLSEGELAALQNYFHGNWLIAKCNEEAVQVPRKTWEEIEKRMLLWAS